MAVFLRVDGVAGSEEDKGGCGGGICEAGWEGGSV